MGKEEDTFLFINFVLCSKNKTCQMLGLEPKSKGRVPMSKNKHKYIVDKPDHEKTTAELQRELLYLRAENAYLKKLDALLNPPKKDNKQG